MSISERITQARHDRGARRALRAQHEHLVRELSAYSTPAERLEIELIAARAPHEDGALVLNILNELPTTGR